MLNRDTVEQEVSGLYLTTIGRAAESAGVAYWVNQVMTGNLTVAQVGQSFFDQPEVQSKYNGLDTTSFIESVYQNVLGRDAEQAGIDYWKEQLDSEAFSQDRFIEAVNNGATGDDASRLENMKTVGYYYTKEIGSNSDLATQILSGIDANADSKGDAIALIDFYQEHANNIASAAGTDLSDIYENLSDDDYLQSLGVDESLLSFLDEDDDFWMHGQVSFLDNQALWASNTQSYDGYANNEVSNITIEQMLDEGWFANHNMYEQYNTPESYDDVAAEAEEAEQQNESGYSDTETTQFNYLGEIA